MKGKYLYNTAKEEPAFAPIVISCRFPEFWGARLSKLVEYVTLDLEVETEPHIGQRYYLINKK